MFTLLIAIAFSLNPNEVPQDAIDALNEIPGKKVNLSLVMNRAIESSDSYKQLKAQKESSEIPSLYAEAPYDLQTSFKYGLLRDDTEQVAQTLPSDIESTTYNVKLSRYFSTGTALNFNLEHGSQTFRIIGNSIPEFYESRAELGISQNLLKDFFGLASRNSWQAAQLESQSKLEAYNKNFQTWTKNISHLFYAAWLTKAQVETARESTRLKQRLLAVSRKKLSRGTTEKPDFLQIEASYLNARARQNSAEKNLQEAWQRLVILASLPVHWINIDASHVPLSLDDPSPKAEKICKEGKSLDTAEVRELSLALEAAKKKRKAAESNAYPDLKLNANYGMNGINDSAANSLEDASEIDHTTWFLGLSFSYPIGNSESKGQFLSAKLEERVAEAKKSDAISNLEADWISLCNEFHIAKENFDYAKSIYEKQKLRASLEEKRFRIGRSNVFQMVQAGDDSVQAGFQYNNSRVEKLKAAWDVIELGDQVVSYIQSIGVKYE